MHTFVYIRVSTREQADSGLGLEAQKARCLDEIEGRGWSLSSVYTETASAGRQRPKLERAMKALDIGAADVLMVSRLDRLARSSVEFGLIVERAQRSGWELVVLDPLVDLSTASGRMVAGVLAVIAQWERELISQRTREGLAARKARGEPRLPQHTPYGDERTIRRILRFAEEGKGPWQIAKWLDKADVPPPRGPRWHGQTVRSIIEREAPSA